MATPKCPLCQTEMLPPPPTIESRRGIVGCLLTCVGILFLVFGLSLVIGSSGIGMPLLSWLITVLIIVVGGAMVYFGKPRSHEVRTPGLICPGCRYAVQTV